MRSRNRNALCCLLAALSVALGPRAGAQPSTPAARPPAQVLTQGAAGQLPAQLREVGFDQLPGAQVPLDAAFVDEQGLPVTLGQYFGQRPVLLVLVYYECPMLCSMVLNGVVTSLRAVSFDPGRDFDVVVVSFDPGEGATVAAAKKASTLERFGRPQTAAGWHFLTGSPESIARLTTAVGFRYTYDAATDQFAHAAGVTALTPQGQVARYLFGIDYAPKDVRLALVEAAGGKIGGVVEQLLLYCYHYDPRMGRYSAATLSIVRGAGLLTVLLLVGFILAMRQRERRQRGKTSAKAA